MADLHHPCGLQMEADHRTGDVPLQGEDERFNHRGKGRDPRLELRVC
jgi:hypothetical protein